MNIKEQYQSIASKWINRIENGSMIAKEQNKKILEVCHFASFVISLRKSGFISDIHDVEIIELREEPDFLISYQNEMVGLEVMQFKNDKSSITGKLEKLLTDSALYFQDNYTGMNLIANICFTEKFNYKQTEKKKLCKEISDYVYNIAISGNESHPLPYIDRISLHKHTSLSFNLSGAYKVGALSSDDIIEQIRFKEVKLEKYMLNMPELEISLLIVVGGASPDSDYSSVDFPKNVDTGFKHVYLLNDFSKEIFIIK